MNDISNGLGQNTNFTVQGAERLTSRFAVTDLATESFGAVGSAITSLVKCLGLSPEDPEITVDSRLASLWFINSIYPVDWKLPPVWDAIAGNYQTSDGWIRLHTNFRHHRKTALSVLGVNEDKQKVAQAILLRGKEELETAIVQAGGVAAAMRTRQEWSQHAHGNTVAAEPLIHWNSISCSTPLNWPATRERPLAGLNVLDLTRVLAGPVATRTLAGFGANVLRIDPPDWEEPNVIPDVTLGKRCARLDLTRQEDRQQFEQLLASADLLIHGYRPGALDKMGYSPTVRHEISPALMEVSLNAYGWTGPWSQHRGFDSLVQMSCGIADAGMHWKKQDNPYPLPAQALDHATGYLMAAAAIKAIENLITGKGCTHARLSLARTAELLVKQTQKEHVPLAADIKPSDLSSHIEQTPWGKAHRLKPAIEIHGTPMKWDHAACQLGSSLAKWG